MALASARRSAARLGQLGAGYWRLWTASAISNLGDGISYVAYPWLAGTLTRDPLLIAGLAIAGRLPWLLLTLPAGVLIDRVDRRRLMVAANAIRFVVAAAVGLAVATDSITLPVLYAAAFVLGAGEVVYDGAAQTILPSIVPAARLERANAHLWSAEMVVGSFLGPPLGGLLLGVGLAVPIVVDAGTFGASAGLILLIAGTFRSRPQGTGPEPGHRSPGRELVDGLRWLWRHRLLRTLGLLAGAIALLMNLQYATFILYAQEVLDLDARGFGLLSVATAAGAVLGSQLAPAVSRRIGPGPALVMAVAGLAPAYAAIGLTANPLVAAVALVAEGFLIMVWNVLTVSLRQQVVPDELFGRVNSIYQLQVHGATPRGALAGGAIVATVGTLTGREIGLRAPFLVTAAAMAVLLAVSLPRLTTAAIQAARPAAAPPD